MGALKVRTATGPDVWTVIGGAGGLTQAVADTRYINSDGDTMTGVLRMDNAIVAPLPTQELVLGSLDDPAATKIIVGGSTRLRIEDTTIGSNVPITVPADPTTALQLATKQYVDGKAGITQTAADARYVNLDGDSMTGPLSVGSNVAIYGGWFDVAAPTTLRGSVTVGEGNTLNLTGLLSWVAGANIMGDAVYGDLAVSAAGVGSISLKTAGTTRMAVESSRVIVNVPFEVAADPVAPLQVVTKGYAEANFVADAGGTMTGPLVLSGAPTANLHAATKAYVDTVTINAQTGTTYTFVLTDAGKLVTSGNATATTFTMPSNSSVAFPIGTQIHLIQWGAGKLTVTGPDIRGTPSLIFHAQYSMATLIKLATEVWILVGDT